MNAEKVNVYAACDRAIQAMDRLNLEAFGKLKMAKWDKISIIKTVVAVYRKSAKQARKRYYEIGFESYLLGMAMCGIDSRKAHKLAEKAITVEWVDRILEQTDFLTLYRFDKETERKAYRLAETLEASQDRDFEINKALRFWSQQVGQYAINVTDYAMVQAYEDAGIEMAMWIAMIDGKECHECHALHGQSFRIEELPRKPHWGCRCHWVPVFRKEDE